MYEVELKIEMTEREKRDLVSKFKEIGFPLVKVTPQNDYYTHAEKSPHGGYDFIRYRDEDGHYICTEKIWEMTEAAPARRENEHEVSRQEFDARIKEFPKAIKIQKQREWFKGKFRDSDISITIDTVKFDHSPRERYFLEAEIDTDDKTKVNEIKANISTFLKELLNTTAIVEAPGMFAMVFEKK